MGDDEVGKVLEYWASELTVEERITTALLVDVRRVIEEAIADPELSPRREQFDRMLTLIEMAKKKILETMQ